MSPRWEHITACDGCGVRLRWNGALTDHPGCACGHRPDRAELERAQAELDELLEPLLTTTTRTHDAH